MRVHGWGGGGRRKALRARLGGVGDTASWCDVGYALDWWLTPSTPPPAPFLCAVKDKAVIRLPNERLISTHDGVWNLAADQGHLGVLTITDKRAVWHASVTENFNVSVPFSGASARLSLPTHRPRPRAKHAGLPSPTRPHTLTLHSLSLQCLRTCASK